MTSISLTYSYSDVRKRFFVIFKRIIDVFLSLSLLILLSPLLLIISTLIFFVYKENPLFIQQRGLTLDKYSFKLVKFKTLRTQSVSQKITNNILVKHDLQTLLTPFGIWMRKTGLDELPQLINILLGQMTFVGPRPLPFDDLEFIKKIDITLYNKRCLINSKPGITGLWQVFGNRKDGIQNLVDLDLQYESKKSFKLDLYLLVMTFPIIILAKHSDAIIEN